MNGKKEQRNSLTSQITHTVYKSCSKLFHSNCSLEMYHLLSLSLSLSLSLLTCSFFGHPINGLSSTFFHFFSQVLCLSNHFNYSPVRLAHGLYTCIWLLILESFLDTCCSSMHSMHEVAISIMHKTEHTHSHS